MMNTQKIFSLVAVVLGFGSAVSAQNLNPTVEVTNTYQVKPSEVIKPHQVMPVPDSLLQFASNFDYQVFDKPYQGAYTFKPYELDMRPGRDAYRGKALYLKLGAGYSLHPQLEFVISPEQKGAFQMSVFASHKSYFGKYHNITPEVADGIMRLNKTNGTFSGYEAETSAGFDGRYNFNSAILSLGVGYYGVVSKDTLARRDYNALDFNVNIKTNTTASKYFLYDLGFSGRIGRDNISAPIYGTEDVNLNDGVFALGGTVGPVFNDHQRLLVDFDAITSGTTNLVKTSTAILSLAPKYEMEIKKWDLSLGVKIQKLFQNTQETNLLFAPMNQQKGHLLFPEVRVSFAARDNISLYAKATGGNGVNPYSSILSSNHHFSTVFAFATAPLLDNSVEEVNAAIGVKGNFASRLQFDLSGGCAVYDNALMDAVFYVSDTKVLPTLSYVDYNMIYSDLLLAWRSRRLSVDVAFHYRHTTFEYEKDSSLERVDAFKLPALSGNVRVVYDINSRIYAGLDIAGATMRQGEVNLMKVRLPGYVDLGVLAGYSFNRKIGFWLETGNLLCMNIQRNPLYAEKGPWFTVGLTLNL